MGLPFYTHLNASVISFSASIFVSYFLLLFVGREIQFWVFMYICIQMMYQKCIVHKVLVVPRGKKVLFAMPYQMQMESLHFIPYLVVITYPVFLIYQSPMCFLCAKCTSYLKTTRWSSFLTIHLHSFYFDGLFEQLRTSYTYFF